MIKQTIVEGPFGVKMVESMALAIEAMNLPSECTYITKSIPDATYELPEGERSDISIVTTESVDRQKEVVIADGCNWTEYKKAGSPVLFNHDLSNSIGRAAWIKRQNNGWVAKTLYHTRPDNWTGDWEPDKTFHLVKNCGMKGKSISFIPMLPPRMPIGNEVGRYPGAKSIIESCIILEYSVCPIGVNKDSNVLVVAKKLDIQAPTIGHVQRSITDRDICRAIAEEINSFSIREQLDRLKGKV
jgi:hypothetical protein